MRGNPTVFGVEGLIWHHVVLEEEQRKKGRGEERSQVMIIYY